MREPLCARIRELEMTSVFISHSSRDKEVVRRIAARLEECGVSVWLDENELNPGDSLLGRISESIHHTTFVAVVLSKSALASPWVKKELSLAMAREIHEDRTTVLPILIEECEVPDFLADKLYADFTDPRRFDQAMIQLLGSLNVNVDEYRRRARCLELYNSDNIFAELSDLEEKLFSSTRDCSISCVMLDNATVDYALAAIGHSDVSWWKPVLPSRSDVYAHAVYQLVDALVLYDEVWVGPGSRTQYMRRDLQTAQKILKESDELFSGEALLALANLSRRHAQEQSLTDFAFVDALRSMTSARLDPKMIAVAIDRMTLNMASHSPHYYDDLDEEGDASFAISNAAYGFLGQNRIAMDAADSRNCGRRWGNDEYFGQLGKRRKFQFPKEYYNEFYAGALLVRAYFYLFLCELSGSTYYADAFRSPLIRAILKGSAKSDRAFAERIHESIAAEETERDRLMNRALGYQAFAAPAPPVAAAVLHRAKRLDEILPIAIEMRESSRAKEMRAFCKEVDTAVRIGDRRRVEAAVNELATMGVDLVKGSGAKLSAAESAGGSRELAVYQTPLGKLVAKLIPDSIRKLLPKLSAPRLAFLHELRGTPRTLSTLEQQIRKIGNWGVT